MLPVTVTFGNEHRKTLRHRYADWYVYDRWGNYHVICTIYRDNGDGYVAGNEIPQYAWPRDPARIMINNWHGDNSASAQHFPGRYNWNTAWAYYDYIEYRPR